MMSIGDNYILCRNGTFEDEHKKAEIREYLKHNCHDISSSMYPVKENNICRLFDLWNISVINAQEIDDNNIKYDIFVCENDTEILRQHMDFLINIGIVVSFNISLWDGIVSGEIFHIKGVNKDRIYVPAKVEEEYLRFFKRNVSGKIRYIYLYNGNFVEVDEKNGEFIEEKDIKAGKRGSTTAKDMYEQITKPWSPAAVSYSVNMSNYGQWVCEQSVIVYDDIEVSIYGYGGTPEEAMKNSKDRIEWLKNYPF